VKVSTCAMEELTAIALLDCYLKVTSGNLSDCLCHIIKNYLAVRSSLKIKNWLIASVCTSIICSFSKLARADEYRCDYTEFPSAAEAYIASVYSQRGIVGEPVDILRAPEFSAVPIATISSGDLIFVSARSGVSQYDEGLGSSCELWYLVKRFDDEDPLGWVYALNIKIEGTFSWE